MDECMDDIEDGGCRTEDVSGRMWGIGLCVFVA